jgi:hypothetical protein
MAFNLNLSIEPDNIRIIGFSVICVICFFIFAIINASYKDTENVSNSPEWGSQLLVILLVIAFAGAVYTYDNLFMFIAAIILIIVLVI